jgi:subtilisin family serine protease
MKVRHFFAVIIVALLGIIGGLQAQSPFPVSRGARPPIDIDDVKSGSYEPGKFKIKVSPHLYEILQENELENSGSGIVQTGNAELDELNKIFGVGKYKRLFALLSDNYGASSQHKARHEAWGLHLWFELEVNNTTDIADAVKKFRKIAGVEFAEPEYIKQLIIDDPEFLVQSTLKQSANILSLPSAPNDPQFTNQWHYHNTGQQNGLYGADIGLLDAWAIETGYSDVIVAIIDGGIQTNHPDLVNNIWSGVGYNFVTNTSVIVPHNHGTHVAGTVAASTNNSTGVAGIAGGSGVGDGVRLMSCQVFTNTSNGGFHVAPIWAADNGAAISQNSWGYTYPGVYDVSVLDAIDYFNANGGGNTMTGGISIFAAGNSNAGGQWYPACYSGTLAVAATNNQDVKAWYSNYDTWVDLSAPGGETSPVSARGVLSTLTNNSYGYYQGTSMACPHVSGAAALLLSYALRNNLVLDNNDLKEIIINNTDDHYNQNPSFNGMLGTGRLNAYAALAEVESVLSGLINPSSFVGQVEGPHQIDLSWVQCQNNNDVMLAWSQENDFGNPESGLIYQSGDTINGGGIVVFTGDSTNFSHTSLEPATLYHYRIWSYNANHEYSSGRSTSAITDCGLNNSFPFTEDFNSSASLPECWSIVDNEGNGQIWQIGTFQYRVSGSSGNVAYLNSASYGQGNSQNSDLISPTFDFSNMTDVHLSFRHYFRQFNSTSTASLHYSIDGGASWVNIQTWTSSTSNPSIFNQLMTALDGHPSVRFKWNYTGTYAYYWSIDDVEVNGTSGVPSELFTADPLNVVIGDTVTFSEVFGNGSASSWEWNFGDGAIPFSSSGSGPHEVVYNTPGYKTVTLVIDGIYQEIKENYISVSNLYTLSVVADGPGSMLINGIANNSVLSLPDGAIAELQAFADTSAVFLGWSGDLSGSENPVSIILDADKNITAHFSYYSTATYTEGDIDTDLAFTALEGSSSCPGLLMVQVPSTADIIGVDVSYQMTALNGGFISDQISQLRCVSNGGISELALAQGYGGHEGSFIYNRTGLDLANGVMGTGEIGFELHAGRYNNGNGCNSLYNKVDNHSWTVTVYYDYIPASPLVETLPAFNLTSTSAGIGGHVSCDGGEGVDERGIYLSSEPDPVINGIQIPYGEGTGEFTDVLLDLDYQTLYYFRAYAINCIGTSYGGTQSFETLPMATLPLNLVLGDMIVYSNNDTCYSATNHIVVAGEGTLYTVESGALVEMVAGQSIQFLPGTHIHTGANLYGRIAEGGDYCNSPESLLASFADEQETEMPVAVIASDVPFYRVYPNPTKGNLWFELTGAHISDNVDIVVYSLLGERILHVSLNGAVQHTFDLMHMPVGMYLLYIVKNDEVFIEKIIRQ